LEVGNLWEVKRWLIGYGSDVQVLKPDDLRAQIEIECTKALENMSRSGAGGGSYPRPPSKRAV
jgi:predicted DNA-binding transcriptional regulator YafY